MVNSLHNSFTKLVEILEKFEKDQTQPERNESLYKMKSKIIRFIKPVHQVGKIEEANQRKNNRTGTVMPLKLSKVGRSSFDIPAETINKHLFIESSLQIQILYNNQLKKSNEILTTERNSYKELLNKLIDENSDVYSREKERWKGFIDEFKDICEKELVRKQLEINRLNELLGIWMHKYMELEDCLAGNCNIRTLAKKHKEEIEELLIQSKIHIRPTKLFMNESPFHCRFKSSISTHVSNISGDISPPPID